MSLSSPIFEQILLEDYKKEQNRLKMTKEKLLQQCQQLDQKIQKQLQKIKETVKIISEAAQKQTKIYNQSLNSDSYSTEVIDLATLSTYLKKQKGHLSKIVSESESENKKPKSGINLLHEISNRKKMQRYLQHLQCYQLQKEIEYLEKNILIGQGKNSRQSVIYEDIQSVTVKDEKQQMQRLKLMISELQRLVSLSNECGGNKNEQLSWKLQAVNRQTERLQMIERILDKETKQIVLVKDFFKDYAPKQVLDFLDFSLDRLKQSENQGKFNQTQPVESALGEQEIEFLLNLEFDRTKTAFFKKPFEPVDDLIKICKAKLKKIKL